MIKKFANLPLWFWQDSNSNNQIKDLTDQHTGMFLKHTSSWMCGGRAARKSGLTSVTPSDWASCWTCCARCWIRCKRSCSMITSCRMFSGNAARNDGSTPSGSTTSAQTNISASLINTNMDSSSSSSSRSRRGPQCRSSMTTPDGCSP